MVSISHRFNLKFCLLCYHLVFNPFEKFWRYLDRLPYFAYKAKTTNMLFSIGGNLQWTEKIEKPQPHCDYPGRALY